MGDPEEMPDCRRAHELLSQRMDASLSPVEAARLKAHLAICDLCVRVERQFQIMRDALRRLGK